MEATHRRIDLYIFVAAIFSLIHLDTTPRGQQQCTHNNS
jgi:hypothetical protein